MDIVAREPFVKGLADTPDFRHGLSGQKLQGFASANNRKSARLFHVRRHFGKEFAIGQADRDGNADFGFNATGELRKHHGRRLMMQKLRAGEVKEGLVDRNRLDQRGERQHEIANVAPDLDVFLHIGANDDGVRAQLQRLEHWHGGFNAMNAGDIAGG